MRNRVTSDTVARSGGAPRGLRCTGSSTRRNMRRGGPEMTLTVGTSPLRSGSMAAERPGYNRSGEYLTAGVLNRYLAMGRTQAWVAAQFNRSPGYVSKLKTNGGKWEKKPREKMAEHYPFKHPRSEVNAAIHCRYLRMHARFVAGGREELNDQERSRLRGFYARLRRENLIVEFDPAIPPTRYNVYGCYRFAPRTEDDRPNYLIRINEHTTITPRAERFGYWEFPVEEATL